MASGGRRSAASSSAKKRRKRPHSHHQNLSSLISAIASASTATHSFLSENDIHLLPSQTLMLESQIASAALSLSKLHSLLEPLNPPKTLQFSPPPPPHPCFYSPSSSSCSSCASPCWFQRFLSLASADFDTKWVEAFRMSRPSFELLLQSLSPSLQNSASNLPPDCILGSALFRLAHGASYKAVGRRFGIDSAAACRCFYEVCKAVNENLVHLLESPPDLNGVVAGCGGGSLPNCCGVLGFSRFLVDGEGDGAVIVQGLVDFEGRFLDVSAGWPGSMDPSTILRQSKLFSRVEESKELLNGPLIDVNGTLVPQYVLGDDCCPLLPWFLTPFPTSNKDFDSNSNSSELVFNSIHSRGMALVRTAFSGVRSQWRLLLMKWKRECLEFLPFIVVTGCLLRNFLIKCSEVLPDENENGDDFQDWGFRAFRGKGDEGGKRIRNAVASQLGLVSRRN